MLVELVITSVHPLINSSGSEMNELGLADYQRIHHHCMDLDQKTTNTPEKSYQDHVIIIISNTFIIIIVRLSLSQRLTQRERDFIVNQKLTTLSYCHCYCTVLKTKILNQD